MVVMADWGSTRNGGYATSVCKVGEHYLNFYTDRELMSTIKHEGILLNRVIALEMLHTSRYRIFQVFIRKQRSEVWYCLVLF